MPPRGPRTPEDLEKLAKRRERERKKREAAKEAVKDRSFWVCRHCTQEVVFKEDLWRLRDVRPQDGWICEGKATEPFHHNGQEIDPAADLMRILSEL